MSPARAARWTAQEVSWTAVAFANMNAFFTEGLATRTKLLGARVEMSQVASEAEAHHREEQDLRKLGVENQNSKVKRDIMQPAKILLPSWRKVTELCQVLRGARWESPVWSVLLFLRMGDREDVWTSDL